MDRTKLTPLGRIFAFVLILSIGAIAGAAGAAATRPHAQAWRCISVRPGETLWSIASHNPSPDRREVVQRIIDQNLLGDRALQAATSIWVPNEGDLTDLPRAATSSCPAAR